MVIKWGAYESLLSFQLRKQGILCVDQHLKSIENHRKQSNSLYAAGLIDAETLESIRLKMLNELSKIRKA